MSLPKQLVVSELMVITDFVNHGAPTKYVASIVGMADGIEISEDMYQRIKTKWSVNKPASLKVVVADD